MNVKIANAIKTAKGYVYKHSPEILTGIGVTGMITATVLAVKATPKALELIEEAKGNGDTKADTLPIKTVIKVAWKPYIPAAVTGIVSISCIIGASTVNYKRNAALATAYTISEKALSTYKDKVIETIGEKKEKEMREKIAQDKVDQRPTSNSQVFITPKGNTLCMDSISGRYFKSDIDTIKKAVNELNRQILCHNYISLNEFYSMIGLDSIKSGDHVGWNIDDGTIDLDYSACIAENDEPCIVIDYMISPKYDFDKFS